MHFLVQLTQQYTRYVGFFLLTIGVVGNALNIIVLSAVQSYRSNPTTFYILIGSAYNMVIMFVGLISRILESGYGMNLTESWLLWCKFRIYFIASVAIVPSYCQCFATLDQYFVTSSNARIRQLSTIRRAYGAMIGLSIVCLLHGIPFFVYYEISSSKHKCGPTNSSLNMYFPIFILGVFLFIPALWTMTFGYLTYRNVSRSAGLVNLNADRQLTVMVCMQIILIILSTIPYGIYQIYYLSTQKTVKSPQRQMLEYFFYAAASLSSYTYGCVSRTRWPFNRTRILRLS